MPKIRLPARLENLQKMISLLSAFAGAQGFSSDTMLDVELALEEILVNICNYAFPGADGDMEMTYEEDQKGRLIVLLSDNGIPFDPCSAPAPNLTGDLQQRSIGGLGILLARTLADEFHYQRQGDSNLITMFFAKKKN